MKIKIITTPCRDYEKSGVFTYLVDSIGSDVSYTSLLNSVLCCHSEDIESQADMHSALEIVSEYAMRSHTPELYIECFLEDLNTLLQQYSISVSEFSYSPLLTNIEVTPYGLIFEVNTKTISECGYRVRQFKKLINERIYKARYN